MKTICTFDELVEALKNATEGVLESCISEQEAFLIEIDEKLFQHHLVRWDERPTGHVLKPNKAFFDTYCK